jgi:hypothetical protein
VRYAAGELADDVKLLADVELAVGTVNIIILVFFNNIFSL